MADLFRLIRAPLVFTTTGDVLVGALGLSGVHDLDRGEILTILAVILSSACLYCFGMATNDIFDRRRDEKLHPSRPIPSGRLGVPLAWAIALAFLALAVLLAAFAGPPSVAWVGGMALLILAYNGLLKRAAIPGSLGMGAIRGANVLYGCTALSTAFPPESYTRTYLPAILVLVYITCTTLISTAEDLEPPKSTAPHGRVVLATFIIFFIVMAYMSPFVLHETIKEDLVYYDPFWAVLLISLLCLRRSVDASRATTMRMVRWLLFGLYFFDAHLIFDAGSPGVAWVVCGFVVPSLVLSRILRISS